MTRRDTLGLVLALLGLMLTEYWAIWQVLEDRPVPWPVAVGVSLAVAGALIVRIHP